MLIISFLLIITFATTALLIISFDLSKKQIK